jgi:hypothetical protein
VREETRTHQSHPEPYVSFRWLPTPIAELERLKAVQASFHDEPLVLGFLFAVNSSWTQTWMLMGAHSGGSEMNLWKRPHWCGPKMTVKKAVMYLLICFFGSMTKKFEKGLELVWVVVKPKIPLF